MSHCSRHVCYHPIRIFDSINEITLSFLCFASFLMFKILHLTSQVFMISSKAHLLLDSLIISICCIFLDKKLFDIWFIVSTDASDLHSKKCCVVFTRVDQSEHCADSQCFHLFSHLPWPHIPTKNFIIHHILLFFFNSCESPAKLHFLSVHFSRQPVLWLSLGWCFQTIIQHILLPLYCI